MKTLLDKILQNEFYKGGLILTVASILVNVLNYFFNFLVGRSLGPSGYGEISTLFSYVTILSVPTTIFTTIIIQKIGAAEGDKTAYARSLELFINTKLKKYLPFILVSLIIIPFLPRITNLSMITSFVLIPLIVLSILTSIYNSLLQGLKLFFLISIVSLLITGLKVAGSALLALHLGGLEVVILFLCISSVAGLWGSIAALHSKVKNQPATASTHKIETRLLTIISSPQFILTALSVIAITALNNADIIFVKKFFPAEEAGLYGSWSLFAKAIFYVLGPLLSVSFIFFAHTQKQKDQDRSFLFSLAALVLLGVLSYLFYSYFASTIISVFFGSKFSQIIPFLGMASIFGSLYAILTFINNYFLAKKSNWALLLPVTLPIYIVSLFLVDKNLQNIFILNNIYAFVIVVCYLTAFFLSRK